MEQWQNGVTDGRKNTCTYGLAGKRTDRHTCKRGTDGRTDRRMDENTDGRAG